MTDKERIIEFIKINGWIQEKENQDEDWISFYKDDNIEIDISSDNEEVVFIGSSGDFLHLKIDHFTIYTMLGYMIEHHIIAIDYKFIYKE